MCDRHRTGSAVLPAWVSRERAGAEEALRAAGGEASALARHAGGMGGTGVCVVLRRCYDTGFGSSDLPGIFDIWRHLCCQIGS